MQNQIGFDCLLFNFLLNCNLHNHNITTPQCEARLCALSLQPHNLADHISLYLTILGFKVRQKLLPPRWLRHSYDAILPSQHDPVFAVIAL